MSKNKYYYNSSLKFEVSSKNSVDDLIQNLISKCENNEIYYASYNDPIFASIFKKISDQVKTSIETIRSIEQFAELYDFDEKTPGNGYRSFVFIYEAALFHILRVCDEIITKRDSFFFRNSHFMK